jgi:hypothetical protein
MRITGIFKKKLKEETGTSSQGKEWKKQCFILDTGAQFNPDVCITAFGKEMDLIKSIEEGSKVECQVNIYSTTYNDRWYNNINLWQIEVIKDEEVESQDMPF